MSHKTKGKGKKNLKLLFVLEYYPPHTGGVEILFKNICEMLSSEGHEVTVITSRIPGTEKEETKNGVRIKRIPVPRRAGRHFFTFFSLPRVLREAKGHDIIHTTTYNGALPAWLASRIRKIPSIITIHEVIGKDWSKLHGMSLISSRIFRLFERIIVSLPFDRRVAVSDSTRKNIERLGKDADVVHNSVDYTTFNPLKYPGARKKIRESLGIKSNEFLYVFYGRPGVSKGVEHLIKAMPKIREKIPNSRALYIMGTDPKERYEMMKRLLKENASGDAILHKPLPYKELPRYLMAADCIVVPSITEGFGFCVAESCAMKRPVVATNTTSIPEVVSGKFLLVPPRDSDAIAKAVHMSKKKQYMKTPLKRFTEDKMIGGYLDIYRSILRRDQ